MKKTKATQEADLIIESALSSEKQEKINSMLDAYDLNWTVEKVPLILEGKGNDVIKRSSYFSVQRMDTEDEFWACKKDYHIFQNSEMAEMLYRLSEKTGFELVGGGFFGDGRSVYIQLRTGEVINIGENKDIIKKFLTSINSHDGQKALRYGLTDVVISCTNTFNSAYADMKNSFRHTSSMIQKVEKSLVRIQELSLVEDIKIEQYKRLATIEMDKKWVAKIVKAVTKVDMLLSKEQIEKEYHHYSKERMNELLACIESETAQKGETLWGLFNGVTKYTSHVMPVPAREDARLESKYVGSGYTLDNAAFNLLIQ